MEEAQTKSAGTTKPNTVAGWTEEIIAPSWKASTILEALIGALNREGPALARQRLGVRQPSAALRRRAIRGIAPEDWRSPKPGGSSGGALAGSQTRPGWVKLREREAASEEAVADAMVHLRYGHLFCGRWFTGRDYLERGVKAMNKEDAAIARAKRKLATAYKLTGKIPLANKIKQEAEVDAVRLGAHN